MALEALLSGTDVPEPASLRTMHRLWVGRGYDFCGDLGAKSGESDCYHL